ncbi:MAG: hypothetical protein RIQ59_1279 [Bacteroidota bacterium]|jgi:hypothetical protein
MVNQDILLDSTQNQQLQKDGYVVIPFLTSKEVSELTTFFKSKIELQEGDFYATAHSKDVDFRKEMSGKIVDVIKQKVDSYFQNHELLGASFIVKSKKLSQALQPHQDWNIVDESIHRSYNIWIPLVDLNNENGAILVMPQSHLWVVNFRHSSIPCSFQAVHKQIWENMTPLFLKAGEALIYDHALLHASMPNNTKLDRIACACGIIPNGAPMRYYWNNNGVVEEYESSKEFFLKENVFVGPKGLKKIKNVDFDFISIDENKFYEMAKIIKPDVKNNEVIIEVNPIQAATKSTFLQVYSISNIINEGFSRIKKMLN